MVTPIRSIDLKFSINFKWDYVLNAHDVNRFTKNLVVEHNVPFAYFLYSPKNIVVKRLKFVSKTSGKEHARNWSGQGDIMSFDHRITKPSVPKISGPSECS